MPFLESYDYNPGGVVNAIATQHIPLITIIFSPLFRSTTARNFAIAKIGESQYEITNPGMAMYSTTTTSSKCQCTRKRRVKITTVLGSSYVYSAIQNAATRTVDDDVSGLSLYGPASSTYDGASTYDLLPQKDGALPNGDASSNTYMQYVNFVSIVLVLVVFVMLYFKVMRLQVCKCCKIKRRNMSYELSEFNRSVSDAGSNIVHNPSMYRTVSTSARSLTSIDLETAERDSADLGNDRDPLLNQS